MNNIPLWYIKLAETLRLQMVYPAIMVIGSVTMAIVHIEALNGFFSGVIAYIFFVLSIILAGSGSGDSAVTRGLVTLCVFLEIPHHEDGNTGTAYYFLFIITGVLCTLIQLFYLSSLIF